ncbi:hypothetical protein TW65_02257 [Stemphylium lycopersici]|nr:hypothetical protein TW65_02257 [Stemphylium lycopersici]
MTSFNGPWADNLEALKKSVQSMPDQYKSSFTSASKATLEKVCDSDVLHVWESDSDIDSLLQLTSVITKLCDLGVRSHKGANAADGKGKKHLEGTVAVFSKIVVVRGWDNSVLTGQKEALEKTVKRVNTALERVFKMGEFDGAKRKIVWHHGAVLHFLLHWISTTTSNLRSTLSAVTVTNSLNLTTGIMPSAAGRTNKLPDLERLQQYARKLRIPVVFLDSLSQLISFEYLGTYMYFYAYYINTFLPESLSRPHLYKAQDELVTFAFRLRAASDGRYGSDAVKRVQKHLELADSPFALLDHGAGVPAFARLAVGPASAAAHEYYTAAPVSIAFAKSQLRPSCPAVFHILIPQSAQDRDKVTNRVQGLMMAVLERVRQEKGNPVLGDAEKSMWNAVVGACSRAIEGSEGKMPRDVAKKVEFVKKKLTEGTWGVALNGADSADAKNIAEGAIGDGNVGKVQHIREPNRSCGFGMGTQQMTGGFAVQNGHQQQQQMQVPMQGMGLGQGQLPPPPPPPPQSMYTQGQSQMCAGGGGRQSSMLPQRSGPAGHSQGMSGGPWRRRRATGISKKWNIARRSQHPRGLPNSGNDCYRNGSIQPLVNFPRFVNWILGHNTKNGNWPCRDDNPDHSLAGVSVRGPELSREVLRDETYKKMTPEERIEYKKKPQGGVIRPLDLEGHKVENYSGCLPCLLKALIVDYWGKEMVENEAPHNPISFPYNHPSVYLTHQLFQRYFCEDREGFLDEVKDWRKDDPLVTDEEIDRRTRAARRSCMTEQQDADELVLRAFAGIEESFDRGTPDGLVLQEQFDSLFRIYTSIRRVCILCRNEEDVGFEDNIGLRIVPPQTGGDTVTGGIARTLRDTYDYHTKCEACNEDLVAERTSRFDSTPEYLRIHIALAQYGEDGVRRKIKTRIPVEETLDLSSHMANSEDVDAASALYKLHSVTYHSGSTLRSGHYVASVTGPGARKPVFHINDHHLKPLPGKTVKGRSPLTLNPLKMGGSFDAMMLWYEKVYTRDKRKTTDELTVDEGNALMKRLDHKKEGQRDDAAGAGNVSIRSNLTLQSNILQLNRPSPPSIKYIPDLLQRKAFCLWYTKEHEIDNSHQHSHINEVIPPSNPIQRYRIHKLIEANSDSLRDPEHARALCSQMTGPDLVNVENRDRSQANNIATEEKEQENNDGIPRSRRPSRRIQGRADGDENHENNHDREKKPSSVPRRSHQRPPRTRHSVPLLNLQLGQHSRELGADQFVLLIPIRMVPQHDALGLFLLPVPYQPPRRLGATTHNKRHLCQRPEELHSNGQLPRPRPWYTQRRKRDPRRCSGTDKEARIKQGTGHGTLSRMRQLHQQRRTRHGVENTREPDQHPQAQEMRKRLAEDLAREARYHAHVARHHGCSSPVRLGDPGRGEEGEYGAQRVRGRYQTQQSGVAEPADVG